MDLSARTIEDVRNKTRIHINGTIRDLIVIQIRGQIWPRVWNQFTLPVAQEVIRGRRLTKLVVASGRAI